MRRAAPVVLTLALLLPPPLGAWGFDVHRFIVDRAIDLLPGEIRPFYDRHRAFVVERSIDPDLWRTVGFADEPPRHFLDLDAYGPYPFEALPRDYEAAVAAFGREHVQKYGVLPWRAEEMHERLVEEMGRVRTGASPYALENVKLLSAVVAHYVSDAHVPFHAALNYDGQLTGQHGIHSRFETELFARYRARLALRPPPVEPIVEMRDFVFETLLDSFRLVEPLLAADRRAVEGQEEYGEEYFTRFFHAARPVLERRLDASIAAVAGAIAGAWERAGRPDLPPDPPRRIRKVRRDP